MTDTDTQDLQQKGHDTRHLRSVDRRRPYFREVDDLVLRLKGLVLVRDLRERRGAGSAELAMYDAEITRVRERLADVVKNCADSHRSAA